MMQRLACILLLILLLVLEKTEASSKWVRSPRFVLNELNKNIVKTNTENLITADRIAKDTHRAVDLCRGGSDITSTPAPSSTLECLVKSACVLAGTVGTYYLNNKKHHGPVRAASIISLIATIVVPDKFALCALCGSFSGMAKSAVIPTIEASVVLGLVTAGMLAAFDHMKWLLGMGGRLGAIAQFSCTLQFIIAGVIMPTATTTTGGASSSKTSSAALIGEYPNHMLLALELPLLSALTVSGAFFMKFSKAVLRTNAVGAVGITGFLSSLILPASATAPIFCGSFVAMSSPAILPTWASLFMASVLAAISQQLLAGVLLGGWGGKLGTAALMGVVGYLLLTKKNEEVQKE